MKITRGIKGKIAFEFQVEIQRMLGINYTVDIRDAGDPLQGFHVRILKDDRPIESIPVLCVPEMQIGNWSPVSDLREHARDLNVLLCDILERYSSRGVMP